MRWGRTAAGALPIACTTGRIMLVLRSGEVTEPHVWGVPGGKVENGESPEAGALRELREETGYDGRLVLFASMIYKERGFEFHNFLALVPDEFEAELDWENDEAAWFDLDHLPAPLHFGVEQLLAEIASDIVDLREQCGHVFRR